MKWSEVGEKRWVVRVLLVWRCFSLLLFVLTLGLLVVGVRPCLRKKDDGWACAGLGAVSGLSGSPIPSIIPVELNAVQNGLVALLYDPWNPLTSGGSFNVTDHNHAGGRKITAVTYGRLLGVALKTVQIKEPWRFWATSVAAPLVALQLTLAAASILHAQTLPGKPRLRKNLPRFLTLVAVGVIAVPVAALSFYAGLGGPYQHESPPAFYAGFLRDEMTYDEMVIRNTGWLIAGLVEVVVGLMFLVDAGISTRLFWSGQSVDVVLQYHSPHHSPYSSTPRRHKPKRPKPSSHSSDKATPSSTTEINTFPTTTTGPTTTTTTTSIPDYDLPSNISPPKS